MGVRVAVSDGLSRNHWTVAVLQRVHRRCPHAARSRGSGNDEGIYAGRSERTRQAGSVKGRGEQLVENRLGFERGAIRGSISAQRLPASRVRSAGTLSIKAAAVSFVSFRDRRRWCRGSVSQPSLAASRSLCDVRKRVLQGRMQAVKSGSVKPRVMSTTTSAGRRAEADPVRRNLRLCYRHLRNRTRCG